jgi:hypothetical protein
VTRIRKELVPFDKLVPVRIPLEETTNPWGRGSRLVKIKELGLEASVKKAKLEATPAVLLQIGAFVKFGPFCARTTRDRGATTFPANPSPLVAVTIKVLVPAALVKGVPTRTPLLFVRPKVDKDEVTPLFDTTTEKEVGPLFASKGIWLSSPTKASTRVWVICSGGPMGANRNEPLRA